MVHVLIFGFLSCRDPVLLHSGTGSIQGTILEAETRTTVDNESSTYLFRDLPVPRTLRYKFLFFIKSPALGILLQQHTQTKTPRELPIQLRAQNEFIIPHVPSLNS